VPADGLEMRAPALRLLRDRVHVAEPALERAVLGDRSRTGGVIRHVDDIARFLNRVGGGEPHHHALIKRELARARQPVPDLAQSLQKEAARRAQACLGCADF
jgi:hypothetical protein